MWKDYPSRYAGRRAGEPEPGGDRGEAESSFSAIAVALPVSG